MEPQNSGQDAVRCTLCKTDAAPLHCKDCFTHLCEDCLEKHTSDSSKVHNVVSFKLLLSIPKCFAHATKQCNLHCKHCNRPICGLCVSLEEHQQHHIVDILEHCKNKQEAIKRDLQELDEFIYPEYKEAASTIPAQRADVDEHTQKMKAALRKQGEALHSEIDLIIPEKMEEIDDINSQILSAIDREEETLNDTIKEVSQVILDLQSLMDVSDVCLVSKYKSRNDQFRQLPPKHKISFQNLQLLQINREKLSELFVFVPIPSIETEEQNYAQQSQEADSCCTDKPLRDSPVLLKELDTGNKFLDGVCSVGDEEIWTSGEANIMKLYNLQGLLLKSVRTQSGNAPEEIAVTRGGDLVYTDYGDRSINIVNFTHIKPFFRIPGRKSKTNVQIRILVKLKGWTPRYLCSTSLDDLLVMMISDDGKQTRIVRYSGCTEKESIQFDDKGKPLYSSSYDGLYLSENRNSDICVADYAARAVVVVNSAANLRFRYTGPPHTTVYGIFCPVGITTDSQGKILTTDRANDIIHIMDQDGVFLRYIDNCGLDYPRGICVDSEDNLLVAEYKNGVVKKIQYYK